MGRTSNEVHYKYKEKHIKRIPLDVQISEYEQIKAAAEKQNLPVNTFIKNAIRQYMKNNV